jgi:hypothetical protein
MWVDSYVRISLVGELFLCGSARTPIQKKVLPPGKSESASRPGGRTFFCMGVRAGPGGRTFFVWADSYLRIFSGEKNEKRGGVNDVMWTSLRLRFEEGRIKEN